MKGLILGNLALFMLVTTLLSGYEQFNAKRWADDYMNDFNNKWDRVERRMQAQESNRIQGEMLNEMQRHNRSGSYRYGFDR